MSSVDFSSFGRTGTLDQPFGDKVYDRLPTGDRVEATVVANPFAQGLGSPAGLPLGHTEIAGTKEYRVVRVMPLGREVVMALLWSFGLLGLLFAPMAVASAWVNARSIWMGAHTQKVKIVCTVLLIADVLVLVGAGLLYATRPKKWVHNLQIANQYHRDSARVSRVAWANRPQSHNGRVRDQELAAVTATRPAPIQTL